LFSKIVSVVGIKQIWRLRCFLDNLVSSPVA